MAKRKIDCNLEDYVIRNLKKRKYRRTLKLFEDQNRNLERTNSKILVKFTKYLKKKEIQNEIDDLGFEINFGGYHPKTEILPKSGRKIGEIGKNFKIEKKERKIGVPKEFIRKIKKLGLKEKDAKILFETKIDWTAVYSNNKIYCTEKTCDFFTKIDNEEMTNHMINVHKYGEYNCEDPFCNYVGHSKKNLNFHQRVHTKRLGVRICFHQCPQPNCDASFSKLSLLNSHMRLHNNDLDRCQYCPFRYEHASHYKHHLKNHFGIKDFECDQCDKKFPTVNQLKYHYELHEGIIYCCLICNTYEVRQSNTMVHHLKREHQDVLENQTRWEDLKKFTKTK